MDGIWNLEEIIQKVLYPRNQYITYHMKKYHYYHTKSEAEKNRKKGEKIYYEPGMGWYIVKYRSLNDIFKLKK